jgi:transposase
MERFMSKPVDLSKSLAALDRDSTLIVVIEMSQSSWLVAARAPGLARDPLKKLPPEPEQLFKLIDRWREESRRAGRVAPRVCVAFEAGRDGFWLARLLRQHEIEVHVIHPTSIPVKRDHRRAKTDRLDTELLMRAFLGWLRGEAGEQTSPNAYGRTQYSLLAPLARRGSSPGVSCYYVIDE